MRVTLGNEGSLPVYFDSITVRHPRPELQVSQQHHYYPFGLGLRGVAAAPTAERPSPARYNGSSDLQDELGEDGADYSTFFRRYDPALGRFQGIDPLADSYAEHSPYHFALNDPVNGQDPNGDAVLTNEWGTWALPHREGRDFISHGNGNSVGPSRGYAEGGSSVFSSYDPWNTFTSAEQHFDERRLLNQAAKGLEALGLGATRNGIFGYYTDFGWEGVSNGTALGEVGVGKRFNRLQLSSALSNAWNHDFTRTHLVPDAVGAQFGGTAVAGVGFSGSFNVTWLTRGEEASIIPKFTVTAGWKTGFEMGGGITPTTGTFTNGRGGLGSVNGISESRLAGLGFEGSLSVPGIGFTAGCGLGSDNKPTWMNVSGGGAGPRVGGAIGPTQTFIVRDLLREMQSNFSPYF